MTVDEEIRFLNGLRKIQKEVYQNSIDKGFWEGEAASLDKKVLLIHSEVSEITEAMRVGNPPYEKNPNFTDIEMECADVVIRVMDYCESQGYDLGNAILAKHEINKKRPHMHGKAF